MSAAHYVMTLPDRRPIKIIEAAGARSRRWGREYDSGILVVSARCRRCVSINDIAISHSCHRFAVRMRAITLRGIDTPIFAIGVNIQHFINAGDVNNV